MREKEQEEEEGEGQGFACTREMKLRAGYPCTKVQCVVGTGDIHC